MAKGKKRAVVNGKRSAKGKVRAKRKSAVSDNHAPDGVDGFMPTEVIADMRAKDRVVAAVARHALAPIRPRIIIGNVDGREQIVDTMRFPWCAVCSLTMQFPYGTRIGTGWLVNRRVVVTAGHCVLDHALGGWARSIHVVPGRNGGSAPFSGRTSSVLRSVGGWINNADTNYDYGAILFKDGGAWSNEQLLSFFEPQALSTLGTSAVNVAGYPQDKPAGTQWWDSDNLRSANGTLIYYDTDTIGGQSGAPVWIKNNDGTRSVVGIHTSGGNYGTRITTAVKNNIQSWITETNP